MKVYLQPGLRALSGGMGDWVYRIRKGKTFLGMKPLNEKEPSEAQLAQRERFKAAAEYAKLALANEDTRAIYEALSEANDIPPFALGVADFLKPPSIKTVDLSAYHGHEGSPIVIHAVDNIGVVNVHVSITDGNGTTYESGNAVKSAAGAWTYTTTALLSPGQPVQVNVVAKDRPGGTAEQNIPITIS